VNAFPNGPVRLIDPFGAGGGPDLVGRALARVLADRWGHPVSVVNHPGAGSTAGPALVARSPADGRTVLVSTSAHAYGAAFALDLPYDPLEDFVPVAALTSQPYVLVAGSHAGFANLAELISVARARPGSIRFGSTGTGTASHVRVEVLNRELGIDARHVPAHGEEGIVDTIHHILAGATDFAMAPIAITLPHLRAGRLIALGVTTARRSRVIPDVVTLNEAGPTAFRFDFPIWYGTWVPSKTPPEVVPVLADAIGSALADPGLRSWLTEHDADPFAMSHSEFALFVRSEADMAARVAAAG
jgi:tripartite-type tricarboxylate transporter receptor subunit TctC